MTAVLSIYCWGAAVALYTLMCRAMNGIVNPLALVSVFMHVPSRRNGIPWLAQAIGKAVVWPIVFGAWLASGRPASTILFGPAAALKLGIEPNTLGYATNGFATMWRG